LTQFRGGGGGGGGGGFLCPSLHVGFSGFFYGHIEFYKTMGKTKINL
jgi:hypothetical protein